MAVNPSATRDWAAFAIGGALGVGVMVLVPVSGVGFHPARSFGPDLAIGNLSTWWVYLVGPVTGAVIAVGVAHVLRGPAKVEEAAAAVGTPLDRAT